MRIRSPFTVGREQELARIRTALRASARGQGSAIFVAGDHGMGKSRLVLDAVEQAQSCGMAVLRGRGSTTGPGAPFRALSQALLSFARIAPKGFPDGLGAYRAVLGQLVPDWADGTRSDMPYSLVVIAEAVLRVIAQAGAGQGCLLVLDDMHHADVETLAVVEYLASNVSDVPAVVLATLTGDAGTAGDLAIEIARRGDGALLSLSGLGRDDVQALARACLDADCGELQPAVTQLLVDYCEGTPLLVEELLQELVSGGDLSRGPHGWQLDHATGGEVPTTLVNIIAHRVEGLGWEGAHLLLVAAMLGERFPVPAVRWATKADERVLLGHLRAAVSLGVLTPDEDPDWYAFRHPLAVQALLARFPPAEETVLAGRIADAIAEHLPDLPDGWWQLVAGLRLREGRRRTAGQMFLSAGRRALLAGAAGSAVNLLEQAHALLGTDGDDDDRSDAMRTLLIALAENGQADRAGELGRALRALTPARDATAHVETVVRLAWAAKVAGRYREAARHVQTARALLPERPSGWQQILVDTVDAYATVFGQGSGQEHDSVMRARRAAEQAEGMGQPYAACQAWNAVGMAARGWSLTESDACFERIRQIAVGHELVTWDIYALVGLGGNAWLATADTTVLQQARAEASRTGWIVQALSVEATLALHDALRDDRTSAWARLSTIVDTCRRMQLDAVARYAFMVETVLAGLQADRDALAVAVSRFEALDGAVSPELPLVRGLAFGICALLEEDRAAALDCLRPAPDDRGPYYLTGRHGIGLLLDVVDGRAGWPEYERIAATSAGAMRWNRQFVNLARAILLGRQRRVREAMTVVEEAAALAVPFATAWHLGLRLVGEAARRDGWGEPEVWLNEAEEYFADRRIPAVAQACRDWRRGPGAKSRSGATTADRVPTSLRRLGITPREFEVYQLLAQRLGNKAVAARLHISPRTAEKHVASLLDKICAPNRDAVADHAARHLDAVMVFRGLDGAPEESA
jgi:DNA-binding CsgD family transcriptional regulator